MKNIIFLVTISLGLNSFASNDKKQIDVLRLGFMNIHTNEQAYDAIIIPGYPHNGESWNLTIKMRMIWAKYLYDNGFANNIIVSGSAVYTPYQEAEVMAMYAEAMGIPIENIYLEKEAEHSTENVYYSYQLAKSLGFDRIALATDPIQMTFLLRDFMKTEDLDIAKLPVHFGILNTLDHTEPEIDHECALVENFVSIEVRETKEERMKGTKGEKIKR